MLRPAIAAVMAVTVLAVSMGAAPVGAGAAPGPAAPQGLSWRSRPLIPARRAEVSLPGTATGVSTNWSGYVVSGAAGAFTSISGCWTVPAVSAASAGGYSAAWVGIDGGVPGDGWLLQTGTEQDVSGGSAQYSAWWELITPAALPPSTTVFPVNPQDLICASVSQLAPGEWSVSIQDLSSAARFQTPVSWDGPQETAEWVMEAPSACSSQSCQILPLADYGAVTFDQAELNGSNPGLLTSEEVDMLAAPGGPALSIPSVPSSAGDGFAITYTGPGAQTSGAPAGGGVSASGDAYTPLQPFRVCDTRPGTGTPCTGSALGPGGFLYLTLAGAAGGAGQAIPVAAQAVVVNVTAIQGSAGTYLTLYPAGAARPTASDLNAAPGSVDANLAVVALGIGGQVAIYNAQGTINVAVDVQGYFAAATATSAVPGLFHPIPPLRVCDTRTGTGTECSGTPLGGGRWTEIDVSGCPAANPTCPAAIPGDGTAEAVALNLTGVEGTAATFLSVTAPSPSGACPGTVPAFSNLNLARGQIRPNRVIVPLGPSQTGGADDAVCVYNAQGAINVVLDLNGWFGDGGETSPGAYFEPAAPLRICDTRTGTGTECSGSAVDGGGRLTVQVDGTGGIPAAGSSASPVAVVANVTAVMGSAGTYLTLYPADIARPIASDLNPGPGEVTPNLVIVQLASSSDAGAIDVFNAQGTINVVIDVAGWFQD